MKESQFVLKQIKQNLKDDPDILADNIRITQPRGDGAGVWMLSADITCSSETEYIEITHYDDTGTSQATEIYCHAKNSLERHSNVPLTKISQVITQSYS